MNQGILLRDYEILEGENALYINGINIDVDSLDIYQLYNTISKEENLANTFFEIGFRVKFIKKWNYFLIIYVLERVLKRII